MSTIATRLKLLRANQPAKPTTQQVITWARDAEYPMEYGAFGGGILIGPHFLCHLERLAAFAFEAGVAAERGRNIALLLSPKGQRLASHSGGIEQLAAAIQAGEEE